MMLRIVLPIVLLATGCAGTPANDESAEAAFAALEAQLLDAAVLRVDYVVTAEGAIGASLSGDLVTQKPSLAALRAHGDFAGESKLMQLSADGVQMRGGSGAATFSSAVPAALHEGLLLGLLRMGVLHNLAMLSAGAPPDATDGGVRDWVVPSAFAWLDSGPGDNAVERGLAFELSVNGSPAGEVRLWFDSVRNLPLRREQIVHFEHGDMRVTEHYDIETGGIVGPCRFKGGDDQGAT